MAIEFKVGMVVRYDYLWKEESVKGQEDGSKDRPCAPIFMSKVGEGGSKNLYFCPITHFPPQDDQTSIEIPVKVCDYLGLDDEK